MFGNKLKMDGIAEAVKKCMAEDEKELSAKQKKIAKLAEPKDKIDSGDLAKLRGEETVTEAERVATATGMKVYGSSYGDSAKARRDQTKKDIDTIKGPTTKQLTGVESEKVKKEEFFKDKLISNYIEEEAQFEEELNEVLSKDATAGDWISDFIHSDNPKFEGKSKKMRQKMALAAYYAKQRNESVQDSYPVTTDTLAGRMPGGMSNSFKQFKLRVRPLDKESENPTNVIPANRPAHMTARDPHVGRGGLVAIPPAGIVRKEEVEDLDEAGQRRGMLGEPDLVNIPGPAKGTKPSPKAITKGSDREYYKSPGLGGTTVTKWRKKTTTEEVEDLDEATPPKNTDIADKSYLKDMGKKPTVKSDIKNFGRFLAGKKETNEGKQPETDNVPFEKPYNTTSDPVITDKSGAKHTPMSRAKDLARSAMKRVKTEMLGKAPGNNG